MAWSGVRTVAVRAIRGWTMTRSPSQSREFEAALAVGTGVAEIAGDEGAGIVCPGSSGEARVEWASVMRVVLAAGVRSGGVA